MLPAKELIEEMVFRGTPIQAATLIRTTIKEINHERKEKGLGPEQRVAYWDSTDDKPDYMIKLPIEVRFQPGDTITPYSCTVVAMDRPNNEARLKVMAPHGVWNKVAQVWQQIKGVMEKDGWIVDQATAADSIDGGGTANVKHKQGPRRYSTQEKIAARQEWDALDRDSDPVTLPEWLERKFGSNPTTGALNVPESTFYSWPKS